MFSNTLDIRQEISVISTWVNLNGRSVHVNNRKIKNWSVHLFGLTDLNKTMGKMCCRKNSKTYIADENFVTLI